MNFLRHLLLLLLSAARAILYGWLLALIELWRGLVDLIRRWLAQRGLPGRMRKASKSRCVKVSDPAYKRPDPLIYSQYYLMSQGIAVTWDNPDIHLEQAGVPVPAHALKPNTQYTVVARIWNNSFEAPVVGLVVVFSYLSFGIGTVAHAIGQDTINLGVKGGPGHPAFARVPWRTPAAGHYCIQVEFSWIDDVNPNNNLGQTNTDVVAAASPAVATFRLRNRARQRDAIRFEVDAYTIPAPPPCNGQRPAPKERPPREAPGTAAAPARHQRGVMPLPAGWTAVLEPAEVVLGPDEEVDVKVVLTPPASFHGRQPVNIAAIGSAGPVGGVTVYVDVP